MPYKGAATEMYTVPQQCHGRMNGVEIRFLLSGVLLKWVYSKFDLIKEETKWITRDTVRVQVWHKFSLTCTCTRLSRPGTSPRYFETRIITWILSNCQLLGCIMYCGLIDNVLKQKTLVCIYLDHITVQMINILFLLALVCTDSWWKGKQIESREWFRELKRRKWQEGGGNRKDVIIFTFRPLLLRDQITEDEMCEQVAKIRVHPGMWPTLEGKTQLLRPSRRWNMIKRILGKQGVRMWTGFIWTRAWHWNYFVCQCV
jgi:hypothetical protein